MIEHLDGFPFEPTMQTLPRAHDRPVVARLTSQGNPTIAAPRQYDFALTSLRGEAMWALGAHP
jgi:hypothetical protein